MQSDEIPEISQASLEVPGLGSLAGISLNNQTCQYLGIPYAKIPGRFRRSVPAASPWPESKWDGTKFGPYCPQPPRDFYPIPNAARPWLDMPSADEFDCLNLNITVPCLPSEEACPMPVMVFIHGGAFTYGMNSSPGYDGRILASYASGLECPTIIVTINYRLGVYGFLAGRDLEAYGKTHGDEGVGNYGIWDQVLALRWVQKHISAFGGDPARVTLFGQSAGSVSAHCHLLRGEPLFSSAILQSGLVRTCGVLSVDQFQTIYEKMLLELGISLDLQPKDRVEKLLAVSEARLTAAMAVVLLIPVVTIPLCDDGVLLQGKTLPTYAEYAEFEVPAWCPRIILGDAKNECIIWNKSWDNLSLKPMSKDQDLSIPVAPKVLAKIQSVLGDEKASEVTKLYGIAEDTHDDSLFWALERVTTDGIFALPIYFAEQAASPGSVFAYHFNVPSPFDNAWGGLSHHSHDNVLIWGVLNHILPLSQKRVSEQMAEAWVRFAQGQDPWEKFTDGHRWMIFDEAGTSLKTKDENKSRDYKTWDTLHSLGLVQDVCNLSDELCLRTSDLLKRSISN